MAVLSVSDTPQAAHALETAWRDGMASLYRPAFPPAWAVRVAAGTIYDAAGPGVALTLKVQREHPTPARRSPHSATVRPLRLGDPSTSSRSPEGPSTYLTVTPGAIRVQRIDHARQERTQERARVARRKVVEQAAHWYGQGPLVQASAALVAAGLIDESERITRGCDPLGPTATRDRITEWSAKSRENMVWRLLSLDYAPLFESGRLPAMITLTLPGEWERLAPNGKAFKRLIRNFGKRYARAWGEELRGVWKLEFQRRGAPHLHALTAPPHGLADCHGPRGTCARTGLRYCPADGSCRRAWRDWFATTWAHVLSADAHRRHDDLDDQVVDDVRAVHLHPTASANYGEGLKSKDPQRVAVYFTKHGLLDNKEYQHNVPALWQEPGDGPGRFWGTWGLDVEETRVEISYDQAVAVARTARRLAAARNPVRRVANDKRARGFETAGGVRVAKVWRVNRRTGEVRRRPVRRRITRMPKTFGFMACNDGPGTALVVARCIGVTETLLR